MRHVTIQMGSDTQGFYVATVDAWQNVVDFLLIVAKLEPGSILTLQGPLGAGKTTFTQQLARTLGVTVEVPSPTFALMRTYQTTNKSIRRLIHVDAYRIESDADFQVLDLDEELADGQSILVLEWPERVVGWVEKKRLQGRVLELSIQTM